MFFVVSYQDKTLITLLTTTFLGHSSQVFANKQLLIKHMCMLVSYNSSMHKFKMRLMVNIKCAACFYYIYANMSKK